MTDNDVVLEQLCGQVEAILQRLKDSGLARYDYLQRSLFLSDIASDSVYQRKFNGFYRMMKKPKTWYESFFGLLEVKKQNPGVTFDEVLREVYRFSGRVEASFCSKLIATVRPDKPVYDRHVGQRLQLAIPRQGGPSDRRLAGWVTAYSSLEDRVRELIGNPRFEGLRDAFDGGFPQYKHFTDAKKLDLLLWKADVVAPPQRLEGDRVGRPIGNERIEILMEAFDRRFPQYKQFSKELDRLLLESQPVHVAEPPQLPLDEATSLLASKGRNPRVAIVLGSGLGAFADELSDRIEIPYGEIPGWPASTAIGHAGKLILGKLGELEVAAMAGRVHFYEGYTAQQVTFGVRVLGKLGVKTLVLTNAAGGINLTFQRGGLVLISDHINLQGTNPLIGPNDDTLGPRFPDMSEVYSNEYRRIALETAKELGIGMTEGVYAALSGPSYETPAEIRYLRAIGADLVGMSTVPEAIVANHMGMKVLGISCVTNMAAGVLPQKLVHEEVLEAGAMVRDTLVKFLKTVLPRL